MEKYETVIHIVTEGKDSFDAGEKAGKLIDIEGMFENIMVSCEPTRPAIDWQGGKRENRKFETVIHIITEGEDVFEAGEIAGELLDTKKIASDMVVSCEPTHLFISKKKVKELDVFTALKRQFGQLATQQ